MGSIPAQYPPVLLPEGEQLCGPWCYWVVSYHFGKRLLSQTTLFNQIFVIEPRPGIVGVKRGGGPGKEGKFFFDLSPPPGVVICVK